MRSRSKRRNYPNRIMYPVHTLAEYFSPGLEMSTNRTMIDELRKIVYRRCRQEPGWEDNCNLHQRVCVTRTTSTTAVWAPPR